MLKNNKFNLLHPNSTFNKVLSRSLFTSCSPHKTVLLYRVVINIHLCNMQQSGQGHKLSEEAWMSGQFVLMFFFTENCSQICMKHLPDLPRCLHCTTNTAFSSAAAAISTITSSGHQLPTQLSSSSFLTTEDK